MISPLISLMQDQVTKLQTAGISADYLGSAQSQPAKVLDDLEAGLLSVLYVTPEFIVNKTESILERIPDHNKICSIAIDESHCVSLWGEDFRDSYRELSKLKKSFPGVPIIALTATATPRVQADICKERII